MGLSVIHQENSVAIVEDPGRRPEGQLKKTEPVKRLKESIQ